MKKISPKARRAAAIGRRFPKWCLTDGMTSRVLHVSAAFRWLNEIAAVRARFGRMDMASRRWNRDVFVPDCVRASRFNTSLYASRLP